MSEVEKTEANIAEIAQKPAQAVNTSLVKDLAMPIAVVVAGAFIGLGFFFSGGQGGGSAVAQPTGGTQNNNQPATAATLIPQLVKDIGIDEDDFQECFDSQRFAADVQADADNAIATGGRGTPWSIVIGPSGKTYPLNGAVPVATIKQAIATAKAEASLPADGSATDQVAPVTADDHVKGSADNSVIIVEYSDFDCPFCSRFHASMNSALQGETDVAWVYRHFPLDQLHPDARAVAQASECVAELGGNDAFWEFTDGYFAAKQ